MWEAIKLAAQDKIRKCHTLGLAAIRACGDAGSCDVRVRWRRAMRAGGVHRPLRLDDLDPHEVFLRDEVLLHKRLHVRPEHGVLLAFLQVKYKKNGAAAFLTS